MRSLTLLEAFRRSDLETALYGAKGDHDVGVFIVPSPIDHGPLRVIATTGEGWDHVSVSRVNRCPNWPEMEHIKRLFFRDEETAMQLHVPPSDHINIHPHCLHLWRPTQGVIPRPPSWMVGPATNAEA
jgi:hypothetical protein